MRANPYLIDKAVKGKGRRLENIDPRTKDFDEKWLQDLLIRHPDLLPTSEIEPIFYPLVVIGREVPVTGGRIDVLYVSQSGYPVIVETKLWRNPESKREVVAQVLDLAFAFSKWGFDQVEEHTRRFTSSIYGKEIGLKKLFETEFGDAEIDYEGFRENLDKNLEFGRFLVAVVGDKIRSTSLDIINELNKYPGLGLQLTMFELECFLLDNRKTPSLLIVPRIAKRTEIIERTVVEVTVHKDGVPEIAIKQEKAKVGPVGKKSIKISENEFWDRLKKRAPEQYEEMRKFVNRWEKEPFLDIEPGTNGLVFRKISPDLDRKITLFYITTDSAINLKPQGTRKQFNVLGFDVEQVEAFSLKLKKLLGGKLRCSFETLDIEAFNRAIENFVEIIDQEEARSTGA
jgi:hypothetical protein